MDTEELTRYCLLRPLHALLHQFPEPMHIHTPGYTNAAFFSLGNHRPSYLSSL